MLKMSIRRRSKQMRHLEESAGNDGNGLSDEDSDSRLNGRDKAVEEITLIIDNEKLVCSKQLLLSNSDYFRAMFRGNFQERNKTTIVLKGVDANGMRDLLNILQDHAYFSQCKDIYSVLTACQMFLFEGLQTWIIMQLDNSLTLSNCLEVWCELEPLEISPLCWKSKSICLTQFNELANSRAIMNLNLNELCTYLGHINLQCDHEISVFQTAMSWYNHHKSDCEVENCGILKKLLSCINFKQVSLTELDKMLKHPGILEFSVTRGIIESIQYLKSGSNVPQNNCDEYFSIASTLVQSNKRYLPKYPFLLMKNDVRKLNSGESQSSSYETVYYDYKSKCFKKFADLTIDKCANLTGFSMLDYKMKIYLFGGEFSMGKGTWNQDLLEFDLYKGVMEQRQSMPSPRRHFESCICGDYLFVVGGTGSYRVIQDNMCWYNFKSGTWSKEFVLPCSGRQIKCCNIKNQLFVFSLSDRCGYFFNFDTQLWNNVLVEDPKNVIPKVFTPFSIFSYKDNLFLKGDKLIELLFVEDKLEIVGSIPLPHFYEEDFIESVKNHNFVYTLYKHKGDECDKMSLEFLNLDTLEIKFLCKFTSELSISYATGTGKPLIAVKLFTFHHYDLVCHNDVVNPNFF